jgi:hypothetical protein
LLLGCLLSRSKVVVVREGYCWVGHPPNFFSLASPFAHAWNSVFFFMVEGVWSTFFTLLALAAFVAFVMAYGTLWEK